MWKYSTYHSIKSRKTLVIKFKSLYVEIFNTAELFNSKIVNLLNTNLQNLICISVPQGLNL